LVAGLPGSLRAAVRVASAPAAGWDALDADVGRCQGVRPILQHIQVEEHVIHDDVDPSVRICGHCAMETFEQAPPDRPVSVVCLRLGLGVAPRASSS